MGFEVGPGSVVSVDTDSLRAAAARFDAAAGHFEAARADGWSAAARTPFPVDQAPAEDVATRAGFLADGARGVAGALRRAADVYEIVEADTALAMLAADPGPGRARIQAVRMWEERIRAAEARSPGAADEAERLVGQWLATRHEELAANMTFGLPLTVPVPGAPGWLSLPAGLVPLLFGTFLLGLVDRFGHGVMSRERRLAGQAAPVRTGAYPREPAVAVAGLADAVRRIPVSDHTQVRVERYTFADRPPEYAVYITGTRAMTELGVYAPFEALRGGGEAWDSESNLDLYFDKAAESYEAVRDALRKSGAQPGATVHAFGHSQGGMVASHLAREGEYDVKTLVTFGSPVQLMAGAGTLNVSLRHRDDIVGTGLTGGGSPAAGGGAGSVVIQDAFSPGAELLDAKAQIAPHLLDAYEQLAERADTTEDTQLGPIRDRLAGLAAAESVEKYEYAAEREGSG
ncbi:alpha/beta hydrolase [Microbacterium rhizophilus]|uniref:alpha/beta hydrolase n=1 Tax=Microbacterium rhizophilus TaxID=3138934 RepID=UPI0031EE76F1